MLTVTSLWQKTFSISIIILLHIVWGFNLQSMHAIIAIILLYITEDSFNTYVEKKLRNIF